MNETTTHPKNTDFNLATTKYSANFDRYSLGRQLVCANFQIEITVFSSVEQIVEADSTAHFAGAISPVCRRNVGCSGSLFFDFKNDLQQPQRERIV